MNNRKWAQRSSDKDASPFRNSSAASEWPAHASGDVEVCGFVWDSRQINVSLIEQTTTQRSRMRFRAQLPEFIWNAAALEGNTYTLPEVQTLLDGVTVGGKTVEETEQVLALRDAHRLLDRLVAEDEFRLSKPISDRLHAVVAQHEALDAGRFRGEGMASGGGIVTTSIGTKASGVEHGTGGHNLQHHYSDLLRYLKNDIDDPRLQALVYFAAATRKQFYFDGNKRTARLMMVGHLMAHGYETVSVPNARRLEFNLALDDLFLHNDGTGLLSFLSTCSAK